MTQRKRPGNFLSVPVALLLAIFSSSLLNAAPFDLRLTSNNISPAAFVPFFDARIQPDSVMPVLPFLYGLHQHQPSRGEMAFPTVPLHPQAAKFVSVYLQKNEDALQKVKQKSQPYFRIIESVFQKQGLPLQLKYLAIVESGLKKTAVSHKGATGPWQLMPTTARELGLKITNSYDERRHYYKSTAAAAKYLKRLYTVFDDWLLVIAAYNSGPGPVFQAIRKSGSRNFWQLQSYLPAETRGHVKRFIGTHYYFEPEGSEATLTKAQTRVYHQKIADYEASLVCSGAEWKWIAAQLTALSSQSEEAATDAVVMRCKNE